MFDCIPLASLTSTKARISTPVSGRFITCKMHQKFADRKNVRVMGVILFLEGDKTKLSSPEREGSWEICFLVMVHDRIFSVAYYLYVVDSCPCTFCGY